MPLCEQELADETKFLSEIEKVQDIIRKKYRLLKLGKENISEAANEYLKPVVTPLNKLAAQLPTSIITEKNGNFLKEIDFEKNTYNTSENDETIFEPAEEYDTADEGEKTISEEESNIIDPTNKYLEKINSLQWDKDYGVKKVKSEYRFGNAQILFDNNKINILNTTYEMTPGLMELLFIKSPNDTIITEVDEKNYCEIILNTNAHLKYHRSNMPVKNPASRKFINYISPHIKNDKHYGSGLLPISMAIQKNSSSRIDYVYWDDPNELVDRLQLLVASRAAGNPSHDNEIMSIIEELRERGLIY